MLTIFTKTKSFFHRLRERVAALESRLSPYTEKALSHPIALVLCLSVALYFLVEALSRHSPLAAVRWAIGSPYLFFYNCTLVLMTLSLALLFRRRSFSVGLVSLAWLVLGVGNCIILFNRVTPLGATDLRVAGSVFSIFSLYFSIGQMVLIVLVAGLLIIGLALSLIRARKRPVRYRVVLPMIVICFGICRLWTTLGVDSGRLATSFGNLGTAYETYGFGYCFASSLLNTGIAQPEDYSPEQVDTIIKEIEEAPQPVTPASESLPNIIIVQLESFFDPTYFTNYTFSEDPIPNFRALKENATCSSGFLSVPAIGAGTANTEFEVLSGMNLDFFGPGEYPYKTVLKNATCETINYNLKSLGYTCRAIHNHSATFYSRNEIYAQLGFDYFTSREYMKNLTTNPLGWANDSVLTEEIMDALRAQEGTDFIFTVSVQPHGPYPTEVIDETQRITMSGVEDPETQVGLEYLVNQIYECDQFVGRLTQALWQWNEPVVLVLYGDHLPNIEWTEDMLTGCDLYQTEYVIWNNFGLETHGGDLEAYQLSAHVLEQINVSEGILTKLHQGSRYDADYLSRLETLEYDMLYGERTSLADTGVTYEATDLTMGTTPITLRSVRQVGSDLCVNGSGFTKWSRVVIDDTQMDTVYLSEHVLLVHGHELADGDLVSVQQATSRDVLSQTEPIAYVDPSPPGEDEE